MCSIRNAPPFLSQCVLLIDGSPVHPSHNSDWRWLAFCSPHFFLSIVIFFDMIRDLEGVCPKTAFLNSCSLVNPDNCHRSTVPRCHTFEIAFFSAHFHNKPWKPLLRVLVVNSSTHAIPISFRRKPGITVVAWLYSQPSFPPIDQGTSETPSTSTGSATSPSMCNTRYPFL